MADNPHVELRGFDSFELKLGDEMRGERASKGKSLLDVQRDLRIRAAYISAIEDCDASAFPNDGFAAGYVRSYARYLDMDPDDVYRRFCAEAKIGGFTPDTSIEPKLGAGAAPAAAPRATATRRIDSLQVDTRFVPPSNARAARMDLGAGLRGLASVAALALLVGGLGFGGWTVLQNLQRVGFAPLPDAPEVMVSAPDIQAPTQAAAAKADEEMRQTLAALYAAQEAPAPRIEPRDGPIASIDPARAGVFAPPAQAAQPVEVMIDATEAPPVVQTALVVEEEAQPDAGAAELAAALAEQAEAAPKTLNIWAKEDAWLRVTDAAGKVLFTGILGAGEQYVLPGDAEGARLRAGNAGAVYIMLGGRMFGPLGQGPSVAKNVSLAPDAVRDAFPLAEGEGPARTEEARAETDEAVAAVLPQDQ